MKVWQTDRVSGAGVWTLVDIGIPGTTAETAGVLMLDRTTGKLHMRFRRDLEDVFPDDADILAEVEPQLHAWSEEMGGEGALGWLEENASNWIRVAERQEVEIGDPRSTLAWLYHRYIKPRVLPFRTHLPLYSLEAAAGRWGPERDVENEPAEWVEAPSGLRLQEDMFVARVVGRSMEPLIPEGSLCVFRAGVAGTRQNRRVLVVNYGEPGEQRFTIKRYNRLSGERILLEPLNPDFEPWEIDPRESGHIAVIAEFIDVLQA